MTDLKFAKINVRVRDRDAAVAYMRDVLGATVVRQEDATPFGDMAIVEIGGLSIEILSPDRPDSALADLIEKRGEGIDSFAFYVDELDGPIAELESRGAKIVGREGRIAWIHPKNPLSAPIELLTPE